MKKFLSVMLIAAMVITTLVAAIPASAANGDGFWSVYAIKSQDLDGYAGVMHDVPGYEYTAEGLEMVPAPWADSNPYATFQTTDKVYLKDGVYLEVRVDAMSYDAGDRWFGFSIRDQQNVELGKQGDDYGYGVETLIRHNGETTSANYDPNDPKTWLGAMNSMEWYKDLEEGQRIKCDLVSNYKDLYDYSFYNDENGRPILTLKIEWDSDSEGYYVYINDVPAPDDYNSALTRHFAAQNHMAYIGFSIQNNKTGGTVGCTITKFGNCTTADEASVPSGSESQDPDVYTNEVADLADPKEIAAGDPAIYLNGTRSSYSDVAGKPSSVMGNIITVNDDDSINLLANTNNQASATYLVKNDVSYAAEDFPIVLVITRNFCTCTYIDKDGDTVPDEECACQEQLSMLAMAGLVKQEDSSYGIKNLALDYWTPDYVEDDFYHHFLFDWSVLEWPAAEDAEDGEVVKNRINGLRLDTFAMKGTDPARNNFDICEILFFRTEKEAADYYEGYLDALLGEDTTDPGEDTTETDDITSETETDVDTDTETATETDTETVTETETTTETVEATETVTETETATETDAVSETDKPAETETKAPAAETPSDDSTSGGCGGVVGVGAIAVVAIVAAGLVSFKKKED